MLLKANFCTTPGFLGGGDASGLEFWYGLAKGMPLYPRSSCRRSSSPNNKNSSLFYARVTTSNSGRTTDIADEMKGAGVLVTYPMLPYLIESLDRKFTIYKLWEAEIREDFLARHAQSIRGVACNGKIGIDAQLIDVLPCLEIVATNSVGLDKLDLKKCRQRNIAVAYTPDVVTDDVADLAIALMLDTLRHISAAERYVRQGLWPLKGDYKLTSKGYMPVNDCLVIQL